MVASGNETETEIREIPAAVSIRRSRLTVAVAVAVAAVVPALVLRPMRDPAPLAFPLGGVVGFGLDLLRHISNVRGALRLRSATGRYLTAATWTGQRTIDLQDLSSVRARRIAGRGQALTYLVVTDGQGVRMSFSEPADIEVIRHAVRRQLILKYAPSVKISRLASSVLGMRPLPRGVSALWTLGGGELTLMGCFVCIVVILGLASG